MAMQRQKGIKTNEPFEPKNVEDNMKKGGKVMEKAKMKHDDEAQDKKLISYGKSKNETRWWSSRQKIN